jgi:hypothetical protein
MRPLKLFGLLVLALAFSCESDQLREQRFIYDTSQEVRVIESFVIDFESFNAGDIVSEIQLSAPFSNPQVVGITTAFPEDNAAMVFDSSNPTGGDYDIGTPNELYGGPGRGQGGESNDTPLGNVLILSEDLDPSDPDDIFEIGARFQFDFSANGAIVMKSFDILDIEESQNPTTVELYDISGNLLLSKPVQPGGDNSKVWVDLENTPNVAFMEIVMNSSGAIDNITFDMEAEELCTDCDSSLAELTFRYNGSSGNVPLSIETTDGDMVFDGTVDMDDEITVFGNAADGSFTGNLSIIIDGSQAGSIATDCSQVVGPGLLVGSLEVIAGRTTFGGVLCPVQIAF